MKYFWFMEFQAGGVPHFDIFISRMVPLKTYVSPLWYRVVNSQDPAHFNCGTNVVRLQSSKDVIQYARTYAQKLTHKMPPENFDSVGRFRGSSRGLGDTIWKLNDVSTSEVQEVRSTYYDDIVYLMGSLMVSLKDFKKNIQV